MPYSGYVKSGRGPATARNSASASDDAARGTGADEYRGIEKALSPSREKGRREDISLVSNQPSREIGRASCRERVCQVRVDLGGSRIIKKTNRRTKRCN